MVVFRRRHTRRLTLAAIETNYRFSTQVSRMPSLLPGKIRSVVKDGIKTLLRHSGYTIIRNEQRHTSAEHLDFILKQFLSESLPAPLIFDVGANVGMTATRFKKLFPESRLYCFEPVPSTCSALSSNLSKLKNVSVYNLALGASEEVRQIFLREDTQWNSLVPEINEYLRQQDCQAVEVTVSTIDSFIEANSIQKIDLLKIDTEGYETEVLKGAKCAFERGAIDAILLEVGFDRSQLQHSYYLDVFRHLEERGFCFKGLFEMSFCGRNNIDFANALFYRGTSQ